MGSNMMLTICALLLFGLFALGANALTMSNSKVADRSEYSLTAISLAQSVIDEAKTKAFDERTVSARYAVPVDSFATVLGPEAPGEMFGLPDSSSNGHFKSRSKYNDVDDYNNYIRIVDTPRARGYVISVLVSYAAEDNPESSTASRTTCKRMDVTVTCPAISQLNSETTDDALPIRLSYVFSY